MTVIDLRNRMNNDFFNYLLMDQITTEYKINKDKRTIVCIITTIDEIPRRLEKYGLFDDENYGDDQDIYIRTYKGIARCAPEDEWDETYGKRLAEYRAAKARKNSVNAELKKFTAKMLRKIDTLYDHGMMREPHKPEEPTA